MKPNLEITIVDVTENSEYERYLYSCLVPLPFRRYRKRQEYLDVAIPKCFHKKLLLLSGRAVGQIEYASAEVSAYPIKGDNIIVMNCIWVLKKAKGHNFGKQLLRSMMQSEKTAAGFATIALENHSSPWLKKEQMEKLGFKPVDRVEVVHKTKHKGRRFKIHLMWLPMSKGAKLPTWNKRKLLEGVDFCLAHPLYHPQSLNMKEILAAKDIKSSR